MSSFIANAIAFSNDFTTFKLKGGDNNVFPRPNYWSKEIPIGELLRDLDGRTTKLTPGRHKRIYEALSIVQKEFEARFGEYDHHSNDKSIWHWPYMVKQNIVSEEDKQFFAELEAKFISLLKSKKITRT